MKPQHEQPLKKLFDKVIHKGCAGIAKWRLLRWYEQAEFNGEFSAEIRRDLHARFEVFVREDLDKTEDLSVLLAETDGNIVLILKTVHKTKFFTENE